MRTSELPILLRRAAAQGAHITFLDTFTGANGSAPNARWTPSVAGWTIQSNRLDFAGASYGVLTAPSSLGDLTFSWDQDFSLNGSTFALWVVRFVDLNNYVFFQLNGSDILTLQTNIANVQTVIATDSVTRCGSGAGACSGSITVAGNNMSMTVTGGAQTPGTFGPNSTSQFASTGAGVGFGMNTGKTGNWWDNAQLA